MSAFVVNSYGAFFSPTQIAGLQLWLDATTGLFNATSGGSAVTADNSAVARWEDQSGNGNHATQGAGADQPLLKTSVQNSRNVLRFDGSGDRMDSTTAFSATRTMFAVAALSNTTAKWGGLILTNGQGGNTGVQQYIIQQAGNANNRLMGGRPSGPEEFNYATAPGTNFFVVSQVNKAASSDGRFNGVADGSKSHASSTPPSSTETRIGAGRLISTETWRGDIAELLVYDNELSAQDRARVEQYLGNKWGVTI
jgi:hypothetical protein